MNQITDTAIEKLKELEGFRSAPYQDIGGVWTIGYGSTRGVTAKTKPITEEDADDLLWDDLERFESAIDDLVTAPLNDNQYSALCLLIYNVGIAPLAGTLGKKLNAGDYAGAAQEFVKWDHLHSEEIDGLKARREWEANLFLTPEGD